jgi:pectate lyase
MFVQSHQSKCDAAGSKWKGEPMKRMLGRSGNRSLYPGAALALAFALTAVTAKAQPATPDGFALGVSGGGDTAPQSPKSIGELKMLLCDRTNAEGRCIDDTPRVIRLDRGFDFGGSEGQSVERGCIVRQCPAGTASELALNVAGFCDGRTAARVDYDKAGRAPLQVGSNKTLIGVGSAGAIRGKGLTLKGGAHNIIIRNITIADINPQVVWGGDALTIDGADGVWLDHNVFANIGRQMVVTGFGAATHVTLSNNLFDGRTRYAAYCDGHHYWLMLLLGVNNTITVARNWIRWTSGRGPHAGGMRGASVEAHMVNNYFQEVSAEGAANPLTPLSHLLLEGNYFAAVSHPVFRHGGDIGAAFAPFGTPPASSVELCRPYIGRDCVANDGRGNGADPPALDIAAIAPFAAEDRRFLIVPMPAAEVPVRIPGNAGVGHIR